jgi:thiosulfate/3-mercaptopyruvate sulfurtransferase
MSRETLISTDALAAHLHGPAIVVVDCRFKLDDTGWGEREYAAAHVPGAVYAHLDRDLSGTKNGTNGRHPLPDTSQLAATLGRLGIGDGVQVVVYDQDNAMFASRLWWLLRWMGHTAVAVLDGGFAKWTAERRPVSSGIEQRAAQRFNGSARGDMIVDASQVAALAQTPGWLLVDARAPERYRGEVEPLDKVPGHIPGATNHFFQKNVDARGTFLPPDALRDQLRPVIGATPPDHVICYCGSGVTACQNLLALEHVGITGAKLYPGSWSEWCSDVTRPVETGDE